MKALILAAAATLAGSATAFGQTNDRLEEVQVTAGREEQTTSDVAAGVSVVDSEALLRRAPTVSADLLRGVTGAFVQQTTPGQGIPIIRGLKGSEVLHLVDGMRLNNALFRNAPNQYLALVDSHMLSRVEVVRGPSPALYGADAMGGVVQLVSRLPEVGVTAAYGAEVMMDYGSADEAITGHLNLSRSGQNLGYRFDASYQDVGDRRAGNDTQLGQSSFTARSFRTALVALPADNHEWLFDVQYLRQPGTPRHDELVAGFGQTEPSSAEFSFEPNERIFGHARYRWIDVSHFIDDLELHAGYQLIRDNRRTRDTGSTSLRTEQNKSSLYGLTLQMRSMLSGGSQLTYGAEAYFDEVSSARRRTDVISGDSRTVTSRFPDGSSMDSLAVYLNDRFLVGDRLSIDIGGRLTRVEVELPMADRDIGASLSVNDLTGNVGALYDLSADLRLVANLGRGFRAPNIFDLGTLGARPGNRFNIGNPALAPEEVITTDLGLKFSRSNLISEIMIWNADYRDKITSVLTGDIDGQGRSIVQSRNAATVDLWGVEAGGRLLLNNDRYELSGSINYTRGSETDGQTQPADRVPPLNGRFGLLYQHNVEQWLEAYLAFADNQDRLSDRDVDDPRINPAGTAGWATLNLVAGWELPNSWGLTLRLGNLLDKRYREHGSGIDAPGRDLGVTIRKTF